MSRPDANLIPVNAGISKDAQEVLYVREACVADRTPYATSLLSAYPLRSSRGCCVAVLNVEALSILA
jgi:hypothetical protein